MSWGTDQSSLEVKAATCFAFLCRHGFALSYEDAITWWDGLTRSPHPRCRFFRRKLLNYRGGLEGIAAWMLRTIPPKCLIETLDVLVQEHRISQQEASGMQERVLRLLNAEGWK